jgi:1,4-dihydroxy-6-naphthoate synthase
MVARDASVLIDTAPSDETPMGFPASPQKEGAPFAIVFICVDSKPKDVNEIVCAHSPDSDDAFMFYALATKKIRSRFVSFRHVLEDIESLNRKAMEGAYELTAISYHAYPYVADKYFLMASGSSVGDGYGPVLAALHPYAPEELKGKRIAVPGILTTAYLALRLLQPDFEAVEWPFDKILDAVRERVVDAGLVIHEAQLTYAKGGFHNVVDLGRWWKKTYGLPLPLGANAISRSLEPEIRSECCRLMRESIQYALENSEEALNYAMQFARDLEPAQAEKFVGMYVNHYTVDCGESVPEAAQKLLDLGFEAGVIPHRVTVEFVR